MLTVDFSTLGLNEGDRLLDLGCGAGRHTFAALRLGAEVTALDQNVDELRDVEQMVTAMAEEGEIKPPSGPVTMIGDAHALPFDDGHFDTVIAAEILEHIPDDSTVIGEIARVTKPGGRVAVSVPRRWPEQVCWLLSDDYHSNEGGHIRIYRGSALVQALERAGLVLTESHHAHALHAPYWWLKCAVGVERENIATRAYHRMLVWDMMRAPWLTRGAERALNPVLGKSLVLYFDKP